MKQTLHVGELERILEDGSRKILCINELLLHFYVYQVN
jgi:hypothetical protein